MSTISYSVDNNEHSFKVGEDSEFIYGLNEVLSNQKTDISYNQSWYRTGYCEKDFLLVEEFESLRQGLIESIGNVIKDELSIDIEGFDLENYHQYVTNDVGHLKIVSKTRDLFSDDFNFPIDTLIHRLGQILNFPLTNNYPNSTKKMHIIVRINRPNSTDFNPPHKDIYQGYDDNGVVGKFINFWIPVAGVTNKSNLPLAPGSHLLNENVILRTFDGATVEGNKYRVRMIKSWAGDNKLMRSTVKYGQALIFSSHLVHGLGINEEENKTRVALEFRLFKFEDEEREYSK